MKTVFKLGVAAVVVGGICWSIPPLREKIYRTYQAFNADFNAYEQALRQALMPETATGEVDPAGLS